MVQRILFAVIVLFFVTMNVLLWRSEIAGRNEVGAAIPPEQVFQRILTSPDNSPLEIMRGKDRIGYMRWSANIGEEIATGKITPEDYEPDAQVKKLAYYSLDADGTIMLGDSITNRVRFVLGAKFDTNQNWLEFSLRLMQRPYSFGLRAIATNETVSMDFAVDGERSGDRDRVTVSRDFKFEELRHPEKLMSEFGGPWLMALAAGPVLQMNQLSAQATNSPVKWEARNDWMEMHTAQFRVYRLKAHLFADRDILVYVSRVGEILKVEVSNGVTLINEALHN